MQKNRRHAAQAKADAVTARTVSRRAFLGGAALSGLALGATRVLTGSQDATAATPSYGTINPPVAKGSGLSLNAVVRAQPIPYLPDSWKFQPFGLSEVTVGEGIYKRGVDQHLVLARAYPVDRILAVFRRNAGLQTSAQPPGGWEEFGPAPDEQRWGPAEYKKGQNTRGAGGLLRGHYGGHFLSMMSMAYASTGEDALKVKVDQIVAGLKECQEALATQTYEGKPRYSHPGFLSAYGEWQFSTLEEYSPYGEIWAPYYTLHKILDGLVNAYKFTGNKDALTVAEGIGRWVNSRLSRCTSEQLQRMWSIYIGGEYGGMNDSLVELYWLSKASDRDVFLQAAKFFDLDSLIDACATGNDILDGKHANQHIPQFVGYAKLYAATNDERYLNAVKGFFDMIVPGRMYPHGGTGEGEMWGPPNTVAGDIGKRNAESCAAYNMVKVAWQLFLVTGEQRYTEYCERTVMNHILGGRRNRASTTSPENLYMFPVHAGARKEYGDGNVGTCCGGTGLESAVRYQETVYAHSADQTTLLVNLFMSGSLNWSDKGVALTQETDYPRDGLVKLTFTQAPSGPLTLAIRIPEWVQGQAVIKINGNVADVQGVSGQYVELVRTWSAGDTVTVDIPISLRFESAPDRATYQSLHYGPAVYSLSSNDSKMTKFSAYGLYNLQGTIDSHIKWNGEKLTVAGYEFDPLFAGNDISYSMYVERSESKVVFGGRDSGVANPAKRTGKTMLDEIWEAAPFTDRSSFLEQVRSVTEAYVAEGLLTPRNRQKILLCAAQARIEAE